MQRRTQSILLSLCTFAVAPVALAESTDTAAADTTLAGVVAPVMVNQGERYSPAIEGMALQPGDRVLAMSGGSARIAYAGGCVQELGSNEVVNVDTGERCEQQSAGGYAAAATNFQQTSSSSGSASGGASGTATADYIGAAIFLTAVGGAAIYIATDDSGDLAISR